MQINSISNQNFGKIVINPEIRRKFFKDAMSYIGEKDAQKRKNFYMDILNLVEQDKDNSDSFIKVCLDNNIRAIIKDGSAIQSKGSNMFSAFLSTLKYANEERYSDFLNKYDKSGRL